MNYYNTHIYTMKRHIISILTVFIIIPFSYANVVTGVAAIPDGYYASVDHLSSSEAILDALHDKIKNHNVIAYRSLEAYYEQTDFYSDTVWDMYSTCRFTMADANKSQNTVCDAWNKEHSIPQSWFNEGSPMKSDLFHVYPTDARVNNFRGNLPYGEVNGSNGAGFPDNYQNHGLGKKGSNTFSGYTGTVFEPADDYKGDFARTYFYMVARYRDKALTSSGGSAVFTSNKTNLTAYAKNLFLKWHRNDPVSQKEIDRNQAVYGIQNNRNPFIDYPELVEYIWGSKVGQRIDLSQLTPTCEGGSIVPVETPKYGVTWSVCGKNIALDSVKANANITILPETPVSCSKESPLFVGWSSMAIEGMTDECPVLYTQLKEFPAVTEDVTYYAVFAKADTVGSSAPATYFFDKDHIKGWTYTTKWLSNGYWLLESGVSIVSPEIDLAGLESIVVTMRTYGGTQFDQLDIHEADGKLTTLIATSGKSMAEYTWQNNLYIAGTSALTFTCANGGAEKGLGIQSITINATGAGVTYSRYITTEGATGFEQLQGENVPSTKFIKNGQLYILVGEHIYTITGQKIN